MSDDVRYQGEQISGYRITGEHVQELANAFGKNVLVVQPGTAFLWVIGTGNKHYEGARTVYATSEQVVELAAEEDYDSEGGLTIEAAWRIAGEIEREGRAAAQASAYTMPYSDGFSARVMNTMHNDD
jgi:hypothetical protein